MYKVTCPVCGKVGIPDYHHSDVVCPQCGSDLSIYNVIDQISTEVTELSSAKDLAEAKVAGAKSDEAKAKKQVKILMPIAAVAIAATAVLGCLLLLKPSDAAKTDVVSSAEYIQLQDSISALSAQLNAVSKDLINHHSSVSDRSFLYVVRKGDSFWSISKKMYGNGSKYKQIAEINGLTIDSALQVGDTLKIY
ncbi:MAG: LysM peptidoglycan-binding domain-containing protein [Bacteroidales bacterium]|nr:LysM peptidoglycan-binding domain-containing protein [Bacteroidales bacterium]